MKAFCNNCMDNYQAIVNSSHELICQNCACVIEDSDVKFVLNYPYKEDIRNIYKSKSDIRILKINRKNKISMLLNIYRIPKHHFRNKDLHNVNDYIRNIVNTFDVNRDEFEYFIKKLISNNILIKNYIIACASILYTQFHISLTDIVEKFRTMNYHATNTLIARFIIDNNLKVNIFTFNKKLIVEINNRIQTIKDTLKLRKSIQNLISEDSYYDYIAKFAEQIALRNNQFSNIKKLAFKCLYNAIIQVNSILKVSISITIHELENVFSTSLKYYLKGN